MTPKDSSPDETEANHGAPTPTQDHRPGASTAICVPTNHSEHTPRPVLGEASFLATEAFDPRPNQCPQPALPNLNSKADHILGQGRPGMMMPGSTEGSSEKEELSSLAFLLASQQSLQSRDLPLSNATTPGLHNPRSSAGLRPPLPSRRDIQTSGPNTAPSWKHRVGRGPGSGPAKQTPRPEGPPRMCGVYTVTFVPDSPTGPTLRRKCLSLSPAWPLASATQGVGRVSGLTLLREGPSSSLTLLLLH